MNCHEPSLGTYENSVPNGFCDKTPLLTVITRPKPAAGFLGHGLKSPHSCDMESPCHSSVAPGSDRETQWEKSLLLSLESLPAAMY